MAILSQGDLRVGKVPILTAFFRAKSAGDKVTIPGIRKGAG